MHFGFRASVVVAGESVFAGAAAEWAWSNIRFSLELLEGLS